MVSSPPQVYGVPVSPSVGVGTVDQCTKFQPLFVGGVGATVGVVSSTFMEATAVPPWE